MIVRIRKEAQIEIPLTLTKVNRELLFEFFLAFARFENALKTTGIVKKRRISAAENARYPNAEPDWDSFAVSLRGRFNRENNSELSNACVYILQSPPNRQVIRDSAGTIA